MRGFPTSSWRLSRKESWSGNEVRMRSGNPGPDRPRPGTARPGPRRFATRIVPSYAVFFFHLGGEGLREAAEICRLLRRGVRLLPARGLLGIDFIRCAVPMVLMLSVRVSLPLPRAHRHAVRSDFACPNSSATPPQSPLET